MTNIRFERRFSGPPGFTNGGFACGLLASLAHRPVEVTLRRPVPLERDLRVRAENGSFVIEDDSTVLASAQPVAVEVDLGVPVAVTPEQAIAATGTGRYYDHPLFPDCFGCGPHR